MTTASATSRVIIAVFPGAYHCAPDAVEMCVLPRTPP
jgi:hypothetical protein